MVVLGNKKHWVYMNHKIDLRSLIAAIELHDITVTLSGLITDMQLKVIEN